MSTGTRIALGLGIVIVDTITIAIPLTALLAAYVLVSRPDWFLEFMNKVYSTTDL